MQRDQARGDMVRLGIELSDCQSELARSRNDAAAAQRRAEAAQQRRGEVSAARANAEQEIAEAMEQQTALRQTAQAQQEDLAARRAEMAALDERLASAETIAARMAHELQEHCRAAFSPGPAARVSGAGTGTAGVADGGTSTAGRIAPRGKAAARSAQARRWNGNSTATRVRAAQVDDALRQARQKLGDFREERSQLEIERARNESEREHLRAILHRRTQRAARRPDRRTARAA